MLQKRVGNNFFKDINPVVRFLIISDVAIIGAAGLLGPIFALFIKEFIQGGNEMVAGVAAGIYLFSKSTLQIPVAHFLDKIRGEKDDFWVMFVFSILTGSVPLLYLLINTPLQLFAVQFVLGIFTAFTYPPFMSLFTRHIDKNREGTEWSLYFTITDIIGASLAIAGGFIATLVGFPALIITVVILSLFGSMLLLLAKPYIYKVNKK